MDKTPITLDITLAMSILSWAEEQLNELSDTELGDDWWGAYNTDFDVNIWSNGDRTVVTAYPVTHDENGEPQYNMSLFCRVGTLPLRRGFEMKGA